MAKIKFTFATISLLLFTTQFFIFLSAEHQHHPQQHADKKEDEKWPQNYPGFHPPPEQLNISRLPWVTKGEDDVGNNNEEQQDVQDRENAQNPEERERAKWPQNYPGDGHFDRHGDNDDDEDDQGYRGGKGPFFPGHIGHWPGKHDWEDEFGRNRKDDDSHHHIGHGPFSKQSWLDWIFPWRRNRHQQHGQRHDNDRSEEESREDEQEHKHIENGTETVIVGLSGGPVRGIVSYAAGPNKPANVFKGIPFAEPPLGKLRFSPLRKKQPWKGLWDASKYRAACLSNTTRTRSPQHYIGEDCIYVNVFADPKCKHGKPCPVLFYVHGGGFAYDSATMFNDTQIVQKYASDGVVFLIPAYRLGVFGFLDLGSDRTVKRNLGMHDIIFALDWAKREVRHFGGDPKRITIMGNSAGASAVSYLCQSPVVKEDAFQQAIISSGVPFFTPNANLNQSFTLLEHFNCLYHNGTNQTLSDREKVECLRRVDAMELLREQQRQEERGIIFSGPEQDREILPEKNYVGMMKHWKPLTILKMTTKWEMDYTPDERLDANCAQNLGIFGDYTAAALQECIAHYNASFGSDSELRGGWLVLSGLGSGMLLPKRGNSHLARTIIYSTTKNEFDRWSSNTLPGECKKGLVPLGYNSPQAYDRCMARYNETFFDNVGGMPVSYESMHAESFLTSLVNTRLGGRSYVGEFQLANYSNHADDLYFFFGLHYIPLDTPDVKLMDMYYPKMIKNFLYGHAPDKDWKPQSWNGRNYFRIAFNVSDNGTILEWPHGVDGYQDVNGLNFWLRDLAIVERNAREKAKENESSSDENAWKDVFGEDGPPEKESQKDHHRHRGFLPGLSSFLAIPPEEENTTQKVDVNTGQGAVAPGPPAIGANLVQMPPEEAIGNWPETAPAGPAQRELGNIWSAFWLTLTVTVLLAIAVVLMVVTKVVYRYKNVRGYQPTEGTGNGMFTEKTRIVNANGNNSMRYT